MHYPVICWCTFLLLIPLWNIGGIYSIRMRSLQDMVALAQCQLNCYDQLENDNQNFEVMGDNAIVDVKCKTSLCYQCLIPCNTYFTNLYDCLVLCSTPLCERSCKYMNGILYSGAKKRSSPALINFQDPRVLCVDSHLLSKQPPVVQNSPQVGTNILKQGTSLVNLYLGWESTILPNHMFNASATNSSKLVYYIVEIALIPQGFRNLSNNTFMLDNNSGNSRAIDWTPLGKTMYGKTVIANLSTEYTYKFRVTPVSLTGSETPRLTTEIHLNGQPNMTAKLTPPRSIRIIKYIYRDNQTLDVLLSWSPSHELSCYYTFYWYERKSENTRVYSSTGGIEERDYQSHRIDTPGVDTLLLKALSYETTYVVNSRSNNNDWTRESSSFKYEFITPTCVSLVNYDFSQCPPVIVNVKLRFYLNDNSLSKQDLGGPVTDNAGGHNTLPNISEPIKAITIKNTPKLITMYVSWDYPHTNSSDSKFRSINSIQRVSVELQKTELRRSSMNNTPPILLETLNGTETQLFFTALDVNSSYCLKIRPISLGGQGLYTRCFQTPVLKFQKQIFSELLVRQKQIKTHRLLSDTVLYMGGILVTLMSFAAILWFVRKSKYMRKRRFLSKFHKHTTFMPMVSNQQYTSQVVRNSGLTANPQATTTLYNTTSRYGEGFLTNAASAYLNEANILAYWSNLGTAAAQNAKNREREIEIDAPANCASENAVSTPSADFPIGHNFIPLPTSIKHIKCCKIRLGAGIGSGAFGKVFTGEMSYHLIKNKFVNQKYGIDSQAYSSKTGANRKAGDKDIVTIKCAVKILKEFHTEEDVRNLLEEIWLLASIGDHRNIVSLIGYSCGNCTLASIMELCENGSLYIYLRNFKNIMFKETQPLSQKAEADIDSSPVEYINYPVTQPKVATARRMSGISRDSGMSIDDLQSQAQGSSSNLVGESHDEHQKNIDFIQLLSFAIQIANGMEFIASKKMVHRDLATRNILITADLTAKISDFGLARDIYGKSAYHKLSNGKVPIKWMAPESLTSSIYTTMSDVWAYGILLWEIITLGATPYPGLPYSQILAFLQAGRRMEKPDACPAQLYEIMKKCWAFESVQRPRFNQIAISLEGITRSPYQNTPITIL